MKKQFQLVHSLNDLVFYEVITRFAIFVRISEKLKNRHLQNENKCVNFLIVIG